MPDYRRVSTYCKPLPPPPDVGGTWPKKDQPEYSEDSCDCMNPFLIQPRTAADGQRFCGYCKGKLA